MTVIETAPHPFGRHNTPDHAGCRGHAYNPDFVTEWGRGPDKARYVVARGRRLLCPHPSHAGQALSCLLCGEEGELTDEGHCVDFEGCHERQTIHLAAHERYQALLACGEAGAAARREADERRARSREDNGDGTPAPRRTRGPARPTSGRCEHCGEPTKGGRFVAGHDAKLKGDLKRAAESGHLESLIELLVRNWPVHTVKVKPAFMKRAELAHVEVGATWLADVVAGRID